MLNTLSRASVDRNQKVFVAGGTGLVGSALIRKLIEKGYSNIVASYHKRVPDPTIYPAVSDINSVITWVKLDLIDQRAVDEFFANFKPVWVFLAAAKVGGIMANNTYRADFIYENLQIQNNVIHSSFKYGVKKLLFLGSTCIYPKNCPQPMKEEYLLTGELEYTNEPYAIAKIAGMKMCESYNLQYGTNFISVMPTNLYGINDNFDLEKSHVLPALLRKMHLGKCLENDNWEGIRRDLDKNPIDGVDGDSPKEIVLEVLKKYGVMGKVNSISKVMVEIWGSGKPMREFLLSDEMADASLFLMENIDFHDLIGDKKEIKNTHINIGSGEEISIKELAYLVKEIVGFEGELFFNETKPDGMMRKVTDVTKLNSLGWRHKLTLKEGIKQVYDWYCKC